MPDATSHPDPSLVADAASPPVPHPPAGAWAAPGPSVVAPGTPGYAPPWPPTGWATPGQMPGPPPAGWTPPPPHLGLAPAVPALPRTVARVSLVLGIVGLLLAWVPILTWFAAAMLIVAVVLAVVAFASPRQGGAGFAAGGLATALVGLMVSVAMSVPSIMLLTGEFDANPYTAPMGEYEEPEPEPVEELELIEFSVGPHPAPADGWWYGVVVENPNWDWIFTSPIEVDALDADGTVLETVYAAPTMVNGRTAIAGTFTEVGEAVVDHIEVRLPGIEDAELSYYEETGSVYVDSFESLEEDGATVVAGTVWGDFAEDVRRVPLTAIAHAQDGRIIGASSAELGLLRADGDPTEFTITFPGVFPEGTTFEVFGSL